MTNTERIDLRLPTSYAGAFWSVVRESISAKGDLTEEQIRRLEKRSAYIYPVRLWGNLARYPFQGVEVLIDNAYAPEDGKHRYSLLGSLLFMQRRPHLNVQAMAEERERLAEILKLKGFEVQTTMLKDKGVALVLIENGQPVLAMCAHIMTPDGELSSSVQFVGKNRQGNFDRLAFQFRQDMPEFLHAVDRIIDSMYMLHHAEAPNKQVILRVSD